MKKLSGIAFVDLGIYLARTTLLPRLWIYYAGTIPCLLYFLYFFNDMSTNPRAGEKLAVSSCLLALLVIWMKVWHSIFCFRAFETLLDIPPQKIGAGRLIRCAGWQTILSAAGFIVLPAALLLTVPFGWCYAFFQIAAFAPLMAEKGVISESARLALLEPKQNHLALWIVCPFFLFVMCGTIIAVTLLLRHFDPGASMTSLTYVVIFGMVVIAALTLAANPFGGMLFINFAAAIFILPRLLKMFFGWDTLYSMSLQTLLHPGFILTVWALCFLCMDPIVKIGYVVRIYNQRAARSGHDLLKRIERVAPPLLLFFAALALPHCATAAGQQREVRQSPIDESIRHTLQKPAYAWRHDATVKLPDDTVKPPGIFTRFAAGIKKAVKKVFHLIAKLLKKLKMKPPPPKSKQRHFLTLWFDPRTVIVFALLVTGALLLWLLLQKRARVRNLAVNAATPAPLTGEPAPRVVSAEDNPHDIWERMAGASLTSGDVKGAIRYLFLSTVSLLGERRAISPRTSRSNRDYRRELWRRYPDQERLNASFFMITNGYEHTWFGTYAPDKEYFDTIAASHGHIKEFMNQHA